MPQRYHALKFPAASLDTFCLVEGSQQQKPPEKCKFMGQDTQTLLECWCALLDTVTPSQAINTLQKAADPPLGKAFGHCWNGNAPEKCPLIPVYDCTNTTEHFADLTEGRT